MKEHTVQKLSKTFHILKNHSSLPGRITAPDASSSSLTSDTSLGRNESPSGEEHGVAAGLMAVPLAAFGLCDSSPPYLWRRVSLLMASSWCPVEIVGESRTKIYHNQLLQCSICNHDTSRNKWFLVWLTHPTDQVCKPESWGHQVLLQG